MNSPMERLMLLKLIQDYANRHGIEYTPNLPTRFSRVAKHILEHTKADAASICKQCDAVCKDGVCK